MNTTEVSTEKIQSVERCTGIAKVMSSEFFFRSYFNYQFSSVRSCEDRLYSFILPQCTYMIFIYLQSLLNQIVVRINTARNSFVKYCIARSSAHSFSVFYLSQKKRSQAVTNTFILVGLSPPQCGMTRQYSNYQYLCKDLATHRYPHVTPPRTRRTVFLSTR